MAKFFDTLLPEHTVFIARQKVFFVATQAPGGRINLSPKGLDSLRVLDDHTVAYLDLTGSGAETAAHLRVDPRLTLMLCGFGVEALILRLYGKGESVRPATPAGPNSPPCSPNTPAPASSWCCMWNPCRPPAAPACPSWATPASGAPSRSGRSKKGEDGIAEYRRARNARSIDGLPTGFGE
jgi:hypothetical protein